MPKKKRKTNKGSSFERDVCKKLSWWWTCGQRNDVFWRTSGSGARAKTRSKKGDKTFGQYGDVQAADPIGQPLMDLCTIELKRGYSSETLSDFVEGTKTKIKLAEFMLQAATDAALQREGTDWILIVKRDYKNEVLFTPYQFYKILKSFDSTNKPDNTGSILYKTKINKMKIAILICPLKWFFDRITPKAVRAYNDYKEKYNQKSGD